MEGDVFRLFAEIIEITEKPVVPFGQLETNPSGEVFEVRDEDYGKSATRAILDIGLLDVVGELLIPEDPEITIGGASSDMIVVDLGNSKDKYKVGDLVSFEMKYMGALRVFNSYYIEKRVV